ncbi:hypothetical protein JKF63_00482 [Porcisia hertigi]|uniref:Uncharacterized protein n=1 Tax=Porcisia hertigi TaxID=2761500 RepID=A0A836GYD4_9TRYP|nr:hypothetical protein JKF63_00482 [Porcisia hertigi]
MSYTALTEAWPNSQPVQISLQDVRVEEEMLHRPHFTVKVTQPWICEEARVALTRSVTLHAPEIQATQQRTPIGAQKAGTISIVVERRGEDAPGVRDAKEDNNSSTGSSAVKTSFTVPLYAARASYQRPNLYKEHRSLCIVEGPQHPHTISRPSRFARARRNNHRVDPENKAEKSSRVLFVDIAALTPDARTALRCINTEEISFPTTLYFRCAPAPSSLSASESAKNPPKHHADHAPGYGARDGSQQQRRRRVVLLPLTAAGKTFELVCIGVKRERDD